MILESELKIEGLDSLIQKMKELERAVTNLDGNLANLEFDPNDPQSIEQAIQELNAEIDKRVSSYSRNEIIVNIADAIKESGREAILERAAAARLEGENKT